jgi:hypothetical protein
LKRIDTYILKEYAIEELAYGTTYFGKIEIDDDKYVHVRYVSVLNGDTVLNIFVELLNQTKRK